MLAHKVDGEHPTNYSDLLLAAWKLERWAKARDLLLPKTTTTGGLDDTWPKTSGYLFPSGKLKGNHTFTVQSTTVESIGAEEDLSVKPEREEEAESSDEEDPETSSGIGGAIQSVRYIICFANVVKLYQQKNANCFRCGSPDHLIRDCPKDLSKTPLKPSLNAKEGMVKKGGWTPQKTSSCSTGIPRQGSQGLKMSQRVPFGHWTKLTFSHHSNRGTHLCMVVQAKQAKYTNTTLEEQISEGSDTEEVPQSANCPLLAQHQTHETHLGCVNSKLCAFMWTFPGASWIDKG